MGVRNFTSYRTGSVAGLGLALLSASSFGTSGSFADSLMSAGWTPGAVVTTRIGLAALLLTGPALWQLRGRWATLRGAAGMILLYGVAAVAGAQLSFFSAVRHLDVGVALLLEYLGIALVVVWMWARHGHRPRRLTLIGIVAALVGLFLVLNPSAGHGLDAVGVVWGLLAATGLAVFFVLSARVDAELPPMAMAWGGMVVAAVALGTADLTGLLPAEATTRDVHLFGQQLSWVVPVVGLALIAGAFAYTTGILAARVLGAKVASFVGLTEVLFAVIFAAVLLGQIPTWWQGLGGAIVLLGVALVQADSADATPEEPPRITITEEPRALTPLGVTGE
jgi:drug/metabolite transporter (DMT)-like permease